MHCTCETKKDPSAEKDCAVLAGTIAAFREAGMNVVFEEPKLSAISELIRKMAFVKDGAVVIEAKPETRSVRVRAFTGFAPAPYYTAEFFISKRESLNPVFLECVLDHAAGELTRKIEKETGVIE